MSQNVLEFLIVGKEAVSGSMEKVEQKLDSVHGKLDGLKVVGGLALAGAAAAATDFASKSVEAYEEAQKSQVELQDAYKKFPAITDVSIEKLQELNDKIQEKTGFDHNELASAQAKLAMYGVTGKQLEELTPLVADYAAKTGTDAVTAADSLGKALLGKGRALAQVGINFKNTKTEAGNYAEVVDGLKAKVEGTADAMGGTAAGKTKILAEGFKDIQEKVGAGLMPALETLTNAGVKVVDWLNKTPGAMQAVEIALAAITAAVVIYTIAQVAANVAIWTSPVTWIVAGIVGLVAAVVLLATNWNSVTKFISEVWNGFITWFQSIVGAVVNWVKDNWGLLLSFIIGPIGLAIQWVVNNWGGIVAFFQQTVSNIGSFFGSIGSAIQNAFIGAVGFVKDAINGIIDVINGAIGGINTLIGAVNSVPGVHVPTLGKLPHLATGGYVSQGGLAMVGEQGAEVVRLPAGSQVYPNGSQSSGGGLHIEHFYAQANQSPAEIASELGWEMRWAT
ncbi:phage-related protein [Leifsonia sp. EB41]|uniref:hypothetical protein n=1 Tax=Leifsonia sp. EB41 TaxID=3156260 RepID=UPI0035151D6A